MSTLASVHASLSVLILVASSLLVACGGSGDSAPATASAAGQSGSLAQKLTGGGALTDQPQVAANSVVNDLAREGTDDLDPLPASVDLGADSNHSAELAPEKSEFASLTDQPGVAPSLVVDGLSNEQTDAPDPLPASNDLGIVSEDTAQPVPDQAERKTTAATSTGESPSVSEPRATSAESKSYVTVKDGHLFQHGKRLRQWGVNLQSGVFPSYAEIDRLVERLDKLGFNAIRLWPTSGTFYRIDPQVGAVPAVATKGDNSALDRYDYLVYRAKMAGMSLQMTTLHYIDLPSLRAFKDSALAQLANSAKDDAALRLLIGFAPYVSDAYAGLLRAHISTQLLRVNPYTGNRYADEPAVSAWELANESRFIDCALTAGCLDSLPASLRAPLSALWQASSLNSDGSALPATTTTFLQSSQYPAYARVIAQRFIEVSEGFRAHARNVGGPASGVAVQPFIFNTGPVAPNAVAHYAYSRGDVFSVGSYRSPLSATAGLDGSAWLPSTVSGTLPSYLTHVKVENKPLIVYETSFFRPYAFRAEWGPMMAAIALQQDWDGAFLYQYGHPGVAYSEQGRPEGYGALPLPEPSATSPAAWKRDYTYGFHHGGDPVTMASWSLASHAFRSVTESPPKQRAWRFSLDSIFSGRNNYPARYFDMAYGAAKSGSVTIDFVNDEARACSPCVLSDAPPVSFSVSWPAPGRQLLTVRTPTAVLAAGLLSGNLGDMGGGLSAKTSTGGFAVVGSVTSSNGTAQYPAARTLYVIGEVKNTGMVFDPRLVNYASPVGATQGLTQQGTVPLVSSGPAIEFSSSSPLIYRTERFSLLADASISTGRTFTYPASAGVFRVHASP